jgi:hypothetical protein
MSKDLQYEPPFTGGGAGGNATSSWVFLFTNDAFTLDTNTTIREIDSQQGALGTDVSFDEDGYITFGNDGIYSFLFKIELDTNNISAADIIVWGWLKGAGYSDELNQSLGGPATYSTPIPDLTIADEFVDISTSLLIAAREGDRFAIRAHTSTESYADTTLQVVASRIGEIPAV